MHYHWRISYIISVYLSLKTMSIFITNCKELWVRWGGQTRQFTGGQGLVQCLVQTSSLIIMPTVTATHSGTAWPCLPCSCCSAVSVHNPGRDFPLLTWWGGGILSWPYSINIKRTISLFTAKKHAAILTYLLPSKKCTSQSIFLDNVENLSFLFSWS